MKITQHFKQFFRLIRWKNLLLLLLNLVLINAFLLGSSLLNFDPNFIFLSFSIVLITAGGYIINDFFDLEIDKINKPESVIVERIFSKRTCLFFYFFTNTIGMFLISLVSFKLSIVFIFSILLLFVYAFNLKKSYVIGNILVAFLSALPILVLLFQYQSSTTILWLYAYFAFWVSLIREIAKDAADIKGDKLAGAQTLPIVLGLPKTVAVLKILFLFFLVSFVFVSFSYSVNYGIYWVVFFISFSYFLYQLFAKKKSIDFNYLSQILKIMMLIGVLSMIFVTF